MSQLNLYPPGADQVGALKGMLFEVFATQFFSI
jgi:hypothetical protein